MFTKIENFNPLLFLASLGAGGIAVSAFIFIQYGGIFSGNGLATFNQISQTPVVIFLEIIMVLFSLLHVLLSIKFFKAFFTWKKSEVFENFKSNPLVNSGLMAPILSFTMTFNVIIAVVRYFTTLISENFQAIMAPAFMAYVAVWLWAFFTSVALLKTAFVKSFDVDKIHFGWLLQPFTLAMVTVTGTGFAALAKNTESISYNTDIAAAAAFLAVISGTWAAFLFSVKLFSIFKKHLHRDAHLENTFVPTYLIIIPIITLFGISAFRLGHYTEHIFDAPLLFTLAKITVFILFAFQIAYLFFGLSMVKQYWKNYLVKKFHVSQWGLICPFVAFVALGLFFFKLFLLGTIFAIPFMVVFAAVFVFTLVLFVFLLQRQFHCFSENSICDK